MRTCARCGRTYAEAPPEDSRARLLAASLEVGVFMATQDLRRMAWADLTALAHASAETIAAHGDDLQFGGKHCRKAFAALARGLAAVSFSILALHVEMSAAAAARPNAP
ncbi:MAG: hypothetical protein ACEQSX_10710, partial [Baekduiaceae bacterium]